jgi:tetratricopeptide (TPR) repeat protein
MIIWSVNAQNPENAKIELDGGKIDKAKEIIDKSIENPKYNVKSKTWYYRGLIYSAMAGDQTNTFIKLDADPVTKAQEAFQKAIDLEPQKKGYYKESIKGLQDLYVNAINFGVSCYQRKDNMGAMKAFWAAHKLNPNEIQPLAYAMQFAMDNKADDIYKESLIKLTAMPLVKYNEYNSKQTKEESKFKKENFWQGLAFFYRDNEKNNEKTKETCEQGLKEFPEDKTLQGLLMEMLGKSGNYDAALQEALKQAEKNPKDMKAQQNLGIIYEKLGKEEEAIAAYKKALNLEPNNPDINYSVGAFYFNKGAVIMKEVNQMDLPTYNKKGKAEEIKAGSMFKEALPYFEKIDTLKPNDIKNLGILSQIYNLLGLKDKKENVDKRIEALDK